MTVFIVSGRDKSEFPGMNKELSQDWDELALEIKQIQESGNVVEIVSETPDFVLPE